MTTIWVVAIINNYGEIIKQTYWTTSEKAEAEKVRIKNEIRNVVAAYDGDYYADLNNEDYSNKDWDDIWEKACTYRNKNEVLNIDEILIEEAELC